VLAIALTVGFYALALVVILLLALLVISDVTSGQFHRATFYAAAGALALGWSVVPRPNRFHPPGPRIDLAANPQLSAHLHDVAQRVGEPMPADVYLSMDMNAGVAQRGGLFSSSQTRYMVLGLPLMQVLSISEVRAVLAHEFGHFRGGDTNLGPLIYRARGAIARSVRTTGSVSVILWLPFRGYAALFFRITQAVSRAQEYAADALAASTVGALPLSTALRKLAGYSIALPGYMRNEVLPAVSAGFAPPLAAGFRHYVTRPQIATATYKFAEDQLARRSSNPYDSHPPTSDRLAALARMPAGPDPTTEPAAIALLSQLPDLERATVTALRRPGAPAPQPLAWEQAGAAVILPAWRAEVAKHSAVLAGADLANLPQWALQADKLGAAMRRQTRSGATQEQNTAAGIRLLAMAVGVALTAQGWLCESLPGEPVSLHRGGRQLEPFEMLRQLRSGELTADSWVDLFRYVGLANAWLAI
jgi:Zn-dependent protease with chaperone function